MENKITPRYLLPTVIFIFTLLNPCFAQKNIIESRLGFGVIKVINKIQVNPGTKLRSNSGTAFFVEGVYHHENLPAICFRTSANYVSTFVQRRIFKIKAPYISWYSFQAGPSYSMALSDKYHIGGKLLAGGSFLPYTSMNGYFFGKTFGVNLSSSVFIERDISRNIVFSAFEFMEGLFYNKSCQYIISSTLGLSVSFVF